MMVLPSGSLKEERLGLTLPITQMNLWIQLSQKQKLERLGLMYFATTFSLCYHPCFSSTNSSFDPYSSLMAHCYLYFLLSFAVYPILQKFSLDEAIALHC
jgi:hypothetical protein